MKKKLVAFAVTAAMVITSAVPALAWEPAEKVDLDTTKNEIVVDVDQEAGIKEDKNEAALGAAWSTVIDFNRMVGSFDYVLNFSGATEKVYTQRLVMGHNADGDTLLYFDGEKKSQKVVGICELNFSIETNAKTGVREIVLSIDEKGQTKPVEYTLSTPLKDEAVNLDSIAINAYDKDFTVDDNNITGNNQIVIYKTAPKDVVAVEVVDDEGNVVTQPVLDTWYNINSITFDDGTVITGSDITKYVNIEWKAVKKTGEPVSTATGIPAGGDGTRFGVGYEFEGCYISAVVSGNKTSGIFNEVTWGDGADAIAIQQRLAGENRYETALVVADEVKRLNGGKFENVVVATGKTYADALSATALAKQLSAPILLVNAEYEDIVKDYIEDNAKSYSDTTIYVVGGTTAVSQNFEDSLYQYKNVVRLEGANRYQTNVAILKAYVEAGGSMNEVIVATGNGYADALSAAATGKPIMLVADTLKPVQKQYLAELQVKTVKVDPADSNKTTTTYSYTIDKFTIVGGKTAVNASIEKTLKGVDYIASAADVTRLGGTDRYQTNRKIVEKYFRYVGNSKYFPSIKNVFVATGDDYADALTGGALAAMSSTEKGMGSPVVLVNENNTKVAKNIVAAIENVANTSFNGFVVVGGENAVSNEIVQKIA